MSERINLNNDKKISLPKAGKKGRPAMQDSKWQTTIRVPEDGRSILLKIEVKMVELKLKKMTDQDKWYLGIQLLNKLMDFVEPSEINKNTNILKYLELLIDERMKPE